jgi:hypothetical protein
LAPPSEAAPLDAELAFDVVDGRDNVQYFWSVNQDEALLREEFLEQGTHAALDDEDGLIDLGAEIEGPVIQPGV